MSTGSREVVDLPLLDSFGDEPTPSEPSEEDTTDLAEDEDAAALADLLGRVDHDLLRLIRYRTDLARRLVARRVAEGGLAYEHEQELAVVRRFRPLGPSGQDLALLLMRQAR